MLRGQRDVEGDAAVVTADPAVGHNLTIEADKKVGTNFRGPAPIADHRPKPGVHQWRQFPNGGEIEADAGVGVDAEHAVPVLRIVDLIEHGGKLVLDRPIADGIPAAEGRGRQAADRDARCRHRHRVGTVRDEDGVDQWAGPRLGRVGDEVVEVADRLLGYRLASAWVNTSTSRTSAAAVTAPDDVGQVNWPTGQRMNLGLRRGDLTFQPLLLAVVLLLSRLAGHPLGPFHSGKDRGQSVVFLLRDRVELVVVAAAAVDRDPAGGGHHLGDHVVEVIGPGLPPQHRAFGFDLTDKVPGAGGEKAGGNRKGRIVRSDHVAGQLTADELVVRQVIIEGPDHPVAIPPGGWPQLVPLKAVRVGVVGNVEPVAGPPLAVVG